MSRIHRNVMAFFVLLAAGIALGQATAPASMAADYSNPRAAVTSFLRAVKEQDDAAIRDALYIPENQRENVEALLDVLSATNRLKKACAAEFGEPATEKALGKNSGMLLEDRLKAVATADVRMVGTDSATMVIPPDEATHHPGGTVNLRKMEGSWKIDAASLLGLTAANEKTQGQVELAKRLAKAIDTMAREVAKHTYPSAQAVYEGLAERVSASVAAPSTGPATSPASAPSSQIGA
jgi:hypothetical protein